MRNLCLDSDVRDATDTVHRADIRGMEVAAHRTSVLNFCAFENTDCPQSLPDYDGWEYVLERSNIYSSLLDVYRVAKDALWWAPQWVNLAVCIRNVVLQIYCKIQFRQNELCLSVSWPVCVSSCLSLYLSLVVSKFFLNDNDIFFFRMIPEHTNHE